MRWVVVLVLAEGVFLKPDKDRMLTRPGQLQSGLHVKSKDSRKADASLSRWWISTSRFRCWKIKSQKRSSVASLGFKPSELSKQTFFLAKTATFMDIMRTLWNLAFHPTYTLRTVEDLQKATQTIQTQAAAAAEEALAAQKHVEEMEMQQKAQLGQVQWEQDGFSSVLLGTSGKSKRLYRPAKGIRLLA